MRSILKSTNLHDIPVPLKKQSRLSQAPTQKSNPNLTRFFSTLSVSLLVSHLTNVLETLAVPFESIPQLRSDSKSLHTLIISAKDKRKMTLNTQIMIIESILPPLTGGGGGNGGGMDVDGDDEDEEEEIKGFDVQFMKLDADPLELKRLWKEITSLLPAGVVYAT